MGFEWEWQKSEKILKLILIFYMIIQRKDIIMISGNFIIFLRPKMNESFEEMNQKEKKLMNYVTIFLWIKTGYDRKNDLYEDTIFQNCILINNIWMTNSLKYEKSKIIKNFLYYYNFLVDCMNNFFIFFMEWNV